MTVLVYDIDAMNGRDEREPVHRCPDCGGMDGHCYTPTECHREQDARDGMRYDVTGHGYRRIVRFADEAMALADALGSDSEVHVIKWDHGCCDCCGANPGVALICRAEDAKGVAVEAHYCPTCWRVEIEGRGQCRTCEEDNGIDQDTDGCAHCCGCSWEPQTGWLEVCDYCHADGPWAQRAM